MPTPLTINIAVVSDLHCEPTSNTNRESWLTSDKLPLPAKHHPVEALKLVLKENKDEIFADILICPGDITNKMNQQGLISGWSFLNEIADAFKVKKLITTTGNHDVDSHKNLNLGGPHEALKAFDNYPVDDKDLINRYWSEHFFITENDSVVILNLNTSYSHHDKDSASMSVFDDKIVEKIEEQIYRLDQSKIKLCLAHHHFKRFSNFENFIKDSDLIGNSDRLLALLDNANFDLVVHGHKHIPRLDYHNKLPVFCAGSFASLNNLEEFGAKNTFHLIRMHKNGYEKSRGKIQTWEYSSPHKGWTSSMKNVFPMSTGFGCISTIRELAKKIEEIFSEQNQLIVEFHKILSVLPEVEYLIPRDQAELEKVLKDNYNLEFHPDIFSAPSQIQKISI